jgi:hypothetical protein
MFLFSHISFALAILLPNFFLSSKFSQFLSQCSDSSELPLNLLAAQPGLPLSYAVSPPPMSTKKKYGTNAK